MAATQPQTQQTSFSAFQLPGPATLLQPRGHTSVGISHLPTMSIRGSLPQSICRPSVGVDHLFRWTKIEFSGTSSSASARLQLYSYWQSSCSWRVRFALNLKGLSFEYKAIDLSKGEQFSPEFRHLNPMCFVPVLVEGDLVLSDSFAILMYLEENYPENALLPVDIKRRAVNLQVASIVGSSIQPLQMQSVLKYIEEKLSPDEKLSWAQHYVVKGFTALEQLLESFAGKYATGDEVFMADVFLAPQISVAISRFNIDMSSFPTLNRINEAYKVLPAFQASLPERQPDAKTS